MNLGECSLLCKEFEQKKKIKQILWPTAIVKTLQKYIVHLHKLECPLYYCSGKLKCKCLYGNAFEADLTHVTHAIKYDSQLILHFHYEYSEDQLGLENALQKKKKSEKA